MSQSPSEAVPQTEAQLERNAQRFHVEFLRLELEKRKQRNARYSLRAFASLLGIHPSALSRILSGKQEVSLPSAAALLKQLTMTPEERLWFIRSVAEERYRRAVDELTADGAELLAPIDEVATMERKIFELCLSLLTVSSAADLLRVSSLYLRDLIGAVSLAIYRPQGNQIEQLCSSTAAQGAASEPLSTWPHVLPASIAPVAFHTEVTTAPQLKSMELPLTSGALKDFTNTKLRVAMMPLLTGNHLEGLILVQIPKCETESDHQLIADLSRLLGQSLAGLFKRENLAGTSAE